MGAQGTADLDFGAFPGKFDTSVAVTGQGSIVSGSLVEAWIRPVATSDHSADEHMAVMINIMAADIVAGVGFTIYGFAREVAGGRLLPQFGVFKVGWVWN